MEKQYPVTVSIYVATYNHEDYIVRALDSILMQKTKYSYEVLVGEDCSTDNTRNILKEYEVQHPNKLTIFYRTENMHLKPIKNAMDLRMRCRGKYLIALEGDDFWTDENKLEKQVSFLEEHPEYIAVAHNCTVVGKDSLPNGEQYPECKDSEYSFNHFFKRIMPGQLTTVLCRNYMTDDIMDLSLVSQGLSPGDQLTYFSLLCHGRIYCLQDSMSAYRHITSGGSSYSANANRMSTNFTRWYGALLEYAKKHTEKPIIKQAERLLIAAIVKEKQSGQISFKEMIQKLKDLDYPVSSLTRWVFIGVINRIKRVFGFSSSF